MAKLYKLANGMEVLLEENHAAPVISFHILIKVGSAMESKKEAGISHLIEHMLFKGTPTRSVGEIAKEVEASGGDINAYTSFDQTVYFINMASKFSDKGLEILADAVQNPLLDKEELEREKEVVLEEIRRGKDSPSHYNSELLFTKSFKKHPYKNPIIGNEKSVKSFTRSDVLNYYNKWYTPDNITLIVVGNFNPDKMNKKIEKLFGKFKGKCFGKYNPPKEPKHTDFSMSVVENPVKSTYFSIGFNIPDIKHEDVPAIDILSHVLAGSDTSILEQVIKEKKELVNEIYSYAFTPKDPGIFIIGGLIPFEKTNKAISSIWDELHKLHSSSVGIKEINRAKLNIRSNEIYEKETAGGQAGKYAYFKATAGDHNFEEKYYQEIMNVGSDDIMRAAQKYLIPKNATTILLVPEGKKSRIKSEQIEKKLKAKRPSAVSISKVKKKLGTISTKRLKNGIRVIVSENHNLPLVACSAVFLGGLRSEKKNNNGISTLAAKTIIKGTKSKSSVEVAEEIESIAGSISGFSGRNTFGLRSEFLSENFKRGMDLFSEVIMQPHFEAMEIKKEKAQQLDSIRNQDDVPPRIAFINFLEKLFPIHPYGMPTLGTKETVSKLSRKNLVEYYNKILNPSNLVISVAGDVVSSEVFKFVENNFVFKGKRKKFDIKRKPGSQPKKEIKVEHNIRGKEQGHIVMGFTGPKLRSKDHYAFSVLNNILSGQGGRLFLKLRDQMSLAYAVTSSYFAGIDPGFFALYIGTEPSKINTAINGMKEELRNIVCGGITKEEIDRAKNFIVGSYQLERQRNLILSGSYAFNVLYGLGAGEVDAYPKKISKVTKKDILNAVKKYIQPEKAVISIVRP